MKKYTKSIFILDINTIRGILILIFLITFLGVQTEQPSQAASEPVSFAIITDYGNCNNAEQTAAKMIDSWGVDFIVTAGDNNHESGCTPGNYQQAVGNYFGTGGVSSNIVTRNYVTDEAFWPVIGNHDRNYTTNYFNFFNYGGISNYYEFVEGPIHFFMMDSEISDKSTQQTWLQTRAASSSSAWQIAVFHEPAYSGGMHGSNTAMRWDFAGMGIDFVISGHNHLYERILQNGIRYFTAGVAGGGPRSGSAITGLEASYSADGAMRVNASDTSITFEYLTNDGVVRDTFSPGPTINTSVSSLTGFSTTLGTPSTARSYTVSGSNLTANISIVAPTGFEISLAEGGTYLSNQTLTQSGGTVGTTPIYVRLSGASEGTFNGNITHTSGTTAKSVTVSGTVTAVGTTTINVIPTSLTGFSTTVGTPSTARSYTVSGSNLTGNIAITAPTGFQISLSEGGTYLSNQTLTQSGGNVGTTTIYVRLTGALEGTFNGSITHTSGTTAKNVTVSGTVTATSIPTINVSPTSLADFSTTVGTPSTARSYTVSGSNLTGNIAITAPTGFQISLSEGGTYSSSLNLSHSGGTVGSTTIYVRLYSTTASSYGGNITHASTSATTKNVAVSGTVTALSTPTINVSTSSLSSFSTTVGVASPSQTYTVSGSNLTANINIAAVTGYEYSTNGTTYSPNLSLTQTGGTVGTTTIYVRLTGTTAGTFNGSIAHSSSGATTRNVSVNGTVSALTPIINVSTSSLSSFTTTVGAASTARTYTVSGSNLTANINIAAVTGYEYSTNGTTYSPNLSLTQTGGNVGTTTIYVRLTGTTAGTFNGSIAHSSSGATTRNVSVNGTVSALTPTINVSTSSLSSFSTTVGVASPSQTYTVSGSNLTGNIAITAPTGFQISLSEGGTYSSNLNLSHSGGTVGSTTIYVRLYSTTASSYGGDITHASTSATTKNVAVSGTISEVPTPNNYFIFLPLITK